MVNTPFTLVPLYTRPYHLMACAMQSSRLSFCKARSMRTTVSSLSVSEVISMRSVHRWSSLCIPTGHVRRVNVSSLAKFLTLQTYKWGRRRKAAQIMFLEYAFHLIIEVYNWITICVLQLHLDITPELIILGEYCYHRDLENPSRQSHCTTKSHFDVPFLSGQISWKYFKSSNGRSLSIGMQYLKRNFVNSRSVM
jgi:hypothetical protein